jgi:hypothetical protein
MMNEERTQLIRQQRNLLLSNLSTCWPGGINGEQLYRVMLGLFPDYDKRSCVKDLYYLEAKRYAQRKNPKTGKVSDTCDWKEAMWYVTPQGNEVANSLVVDPAIEL